MVSVYDLKPRFQALLRPMVKGLAGAGVTANQVTVVALLLSLAGGLAIWLWPQSSWPLLALPVILFIRMALNAMDGMLAREHAMQSDLGAVLNELGDVIADAGLYLPLALVPNVAPAPLVLLVVIGVMIEMAGVVSVQIGASRRYDGPLGKSDRALLLGTIALLLGAGAPGGGWLTAVLWLAALAGLGTIVNRCRHALHEKAGK